MTTSTTAGTNEIATETIEGAKELAGLHWERNTPVFFHGPPGVGKSAIVKQMAAENEVGFKDIRVGTMLPEDLTGIPVPDLERQVAIWLRANFWPDAKVDGERGIIMFDELPDANRNLQSCIYRVVLDREIGEYKLPDGWWPVAAGNRREDRAAANSISTALANRFAHVHIRADSDVFRRWGNVNDIHTMLLGFLQWRPDFIHNMEGANLLAFPSPRSWEMASKYFDLSPGLRLRALRGIVGEGAAIEVETFFKAVELPDFDDIIKDPKRTMIPQEPASRYALSAMLSRHLNKDNFGQVLVYISRADFGADFGSVVVLEAAKRDGAICESNAFNKWAKENTAIRI